MARGSAPGPGRRLSPALWLPLVLLVLAVVAPRPAVARQPPGAFRLPVQGSLLAGFVAPPSPYGSGHRGVDLAASPGAAVGAAGGGVVAFAGRVAGVGWVSVDHAGGLRTTYGPLEAVAVSAHDQVAAGQLLGRARGDAHGHTSGGLHWGARRDGRYLDPMSLLSVAWRPRLIGPGGWWVRATRPSARTGHG